VDLPQRDTCAWPDIIHQSNHPIKLRVYFNNDFLEIQRFDYKNEEKDFTIATVSPSGQSVVIGSFNRYVPILRNWQI